MVLIENFFYACLIVWTNGSAGSVKKLNYITNATFLGVQTHVIALISTNSALLHALSSLFQLRHQSHQPTPAAVSVDGILATCVKMSSKNNVAIYVVDNFQKMDDLLNEITLNVVVFCYEQSNDFDYQVLKKNVSWFIRVVFFEFRGLVGSCGYTWTRQYWDWSGCLVS